MCDRCAELEETIIQLKAAMKDNPQEDLVLALRQRLSKRMLRTGRPQVARFVAILYLRRGKYVGSNRLLDLIPGRNEDRNPEIVRVWAFAARGALPEGSIQTTQGVGYRLTDTGIAFLDNLLGDAIAA